MKKLLIVFNHPAPYKVRLFNELSKHYDVNVIFERTKASDRSKDFYFENEYKFNQIKIKGVEIGRENFISNGIVKHLKENKYDLIIMNGYSTFAEMKAIRYLKKNKIPYIFYINGGIIRKKESKFRKNLKTKYISNASLYMCPDPRSAKYLKYYGAEESKIRCYTYSTIFENEMAVNNERNSKKFTSSGQLIERKNYFELVKLWLSMPKDYELFIYGDGPQKGKIVDFVIKNRMQNVHISGFLNRNEMLEQIKNSAAFIFPSNEDIYGHVINESLSQGVPVISTNNVNSSLKLIKNEFNGFILDDLNEETLKKAIDYCVNNDLFENCIKTAKENTIEKMLEDHINIFSEVD